MISVHTSKPVALDSPDHTHPHGTMRDNSVNPAFNRKLYEMFPTDRVRLLDIGCAGGGFVKSVLDDGGFAIGIDGSDYNLKHQRAEWATIPGNLFCADATVEFGVWRTIGDGVAPTLFNVVTAWEFMEHVSTARLPQVVKNIRWNTAQHSIIIGSINSASYIFDGIQYHQTIRPRDWWIGLFRAAGFTHRPDLEQHFGDDLIRGRYWRPGVESFSVAFSQE